ncbi:MAG: hypothetical protein JW832_00595 [Deltaproteobacteria bacterium]|nr:hypothetical protein [Deltaproteobacteria bacterium]
MKKMKPYHLLGLIALVLIAACSKPAEQKAYKAKTVTRENLFGIGAYGTSNAWIAGYEGLIIHTSDGGANWEYQKAPSSTDLYKPFFIDSTTGWIVGRQGTVLHTIDGGKTWAQQNTGSQERLFDICFIDHETGWAVGTMGTILHTTDGGKTWVAQGFGEDRYYNSVFFIDAQRGWVVGEYGKIYHTEDGGQKWVEQICQDIIPKEDDFDFPPPPPSLYSVYFVSPLRGWAAGMDGTVIRTDDGGATWNKVVTVAKFALYSLSVHGMQGWAIGDRGEYIRSTDGGTTWIRVDASIKTRNWLRDMVFTDENHGWVVGMSGTILRSEDGGSTWKTVSGTVIDDIK